jgi:hypothetical protein
MPTGNQHEQRDYHKINGWAKNNHFKLEQIRKRCTLSAHKQFKFMAMLSGKFGKKVAGVRSNNSERIYIINPATS